MDEAKYIPEELIPEKGSEGVGEAVATILSEIFDYREEEKVPERCNRHYKMKRNKHWKYTGTELALLSANLCGTHHKKTVNMLTANNPTFNLVAAGDLGDQAEEILSLQKHTADQWWNDTEQQMVFRESVDSGELYGTVGEYCFLDLTVNYPYGEIMVEPLDMLYMSMYPPECRQMRKAEAFLRWYPMSVREARRRWPESAGEIVGDMSLLEEIGDERNQEHRNIDKPSVTQVVISTVTKLISGEKPRGEVSESDKTFIIECWVKDYSTETIVQTDPITGEEIEIENPVYPGNIRRVIICNAGNVVLSDDYNPSLNQGLPEEVLQENYLYSRFPFSYVQPVPDPSSPFGLSDFEQLEKLNMELNKAMSQFTMFKDKASRLKMVNPKDSGVTDDEINNVDGILRPTNYLVAQSLKYVDPPQMGNDIIAALGLYKDLFNEVAGSFSDVTQGKKQGSEVIAAKAIALLLEQEARAAQGKGQSYAKMLRERGRIFLALAQMWYDRPRYVTFQNKGRKQTEAVTGEKLRAPSMLSVVSGSTMPVSDIYRREEVLTLFKMGLVDQEEVLKTLDIDNANDIISRMQRGPLGKFLGKLRMLGIPKEMLGLFQKLGGMDEKEIERALKEQKIPSFQQILMKLMQAQSRQQPQPDPAQIELQIKAKEADAKTRKVNAEIQKINSDAALVGEQIITEKIEQQRRSEGIKIDWENIKLEKAKAIKDMQSKDKSQNLEKVKIASDIADKATSQDAADRAEDRALASVRQDPGPYDEKGMVTNNKEPE